MNLDALTKEEREQFSGENNVLLNGDTPVALYMRYSSERQSEQSIEGQLRGLIDYCKHHNYRVSAIYVDRAISAHASMEKRPSFQQMLSDSAKSPWKIVLVYKLDRFARNREDSALARMRLRKNGCSVESAKEGISKNPEGVILEALLEGMAEYYSLELSQKITRGMRESAIKGNSLGGQIPLGYKIENKKYVIDPLTAPLVVEAFNRYGDGETAASICADFNARGYRTASGAKFNRSSFKNIFRNEKYIGVYKYKEMRQEGIIPRIITDDAWIAVQSRLKANSMAPARGKAKTSYLLSGKIFCGHCGAAMIGECGRGRGGITYNYYCCATRKKSHACSKKPVPKDWIEDVVAQDALEVLTDDIIDFVASVAAQQSEEEIKNNTQIPAIRQKLAEIDSGIRNLTKAIETSAVSPDAIIARIAELEAQKKALTEQLITEERGVIPLEKEMIVTYLKAVREKVIPLETQKPMLIDMLVNSVTVYDEEPGFLTFVTAYRLTQIPAKTYRVPVSAASKCSDMGLDAPPLSANPNTIAVVGMVFVQAKKHALP